MSVSFSERGSLNLDTAIREALDMPSSLDIEVMTAAGVSLRDIKKVYKSLVSSGLRSNSNSSRNYNELNAWKKANKKEKDRISSIMSEIFQMEKPEQAQREAELFLNYGGTIGQVMNFLRQTEPPPTSEKKIVFFENISQIAELEASYPEVIKTSKRSIFRFSSNRREHENTISIEEYKRSLAKKFALDTSIILAASEKGHKDLARLLIEEIPDSSGDKHTKQFQILIAAIRKGNKKYVKELLKAGFDPNAEGPNAEQLLILSIKEGLQWAVPLLLKYGAKPNKADTNGITPIHYAVNFGLKKEAELLVDNGAEINHQSAEGTTPLHRIKHIKSSAADKMEMWNLLISLGADPTICDLFRREKANTPLSTILQWGSDDLVAEAFKGYPAVIDFINQANSQRHAGRLLEVVPQMIHCKDKSPYFVPLEIPFLLQDHRLASAMFNLLPKDEVKAQIDKIQDKYPHLPLRVLSEAPFDPNKSYVLGFGEAVAIQSIDNIEKTFPQTEKVARLIQMLDEVLLTNERPEGLKFEGDEGYGKGPKYKDYLKKPGEPGYRDISTFNDANGNSFTPLELRAKMSCLVRDIEKRQAKPGTPSYNKPGELEIWYRCLEDTLCEIIDIIEFEDEHQKSLEDPVPNAATLIEIALTGGNCGGWYMGEAQKIKLQKKQQVFGLQQQVFTVLRDLHERICQKFIDQGDSQNTHVMNLVYQVIDEDAGISESEKAKRFYFLDPIPAVDREGQSQTIKSVYWRRFNPAQIVDEVFLALNLEHSIDRDLVIDWLKENVPAGWKQVTYDAMRSDLSKALSKDEKIQILQDKYQIHVKSPKPLDQQVFLQLLNNKPELYQEFMEASLYVSSMRLMPQMAIKFIGKKFNILLDPQISLDDQLQQHFLNQMPADDQKKYQTALHSITGKSYEESAVHLKNKHGIEIDQLPDIENEVEKSRAYDFIGSICPEEGGISRKAIAYMLYKMGALQIKKLEDESYLY